MLRPVCNGSTCIATVALSLCSHRPRDLPQCPGATLYLTIWASDELSTHLGRTEGAGALWGKHAGSTLVPPNDPERVDAIGRLEPREVSAASLCRVLT